MSAVTRRRLRLVLQLAALTAFTTTLIVHGGWAGLVVDTAGVVLTALGLALMRRSRAHRRDDPTHDDPTHDDPTHDDEAIKS